MTQFTLPLDIELLKIIKQRFNIIFDVVGKNDHSTCHKCGKPATKSVGKILERMIRHVSILDTPLYLCIIPIRYSFLRSILESLKQTVQQVCIHMYDRFVNLTIEVFALQCLVIDRYHVFKLYRKPLDKLGISEMARLKTELTLEGYSKLEGMMWILRKNHECLSEANKVALKRRCYGLFSIESLFQRLFLDLQGGVIYA